MKRSEQAARAARVFALALLACLGPARAESLRCTGGIVAEGDSRLSLLHKCGAPTLADQQCAPVYYSGSVNEVPPAIAMAWVPCQPVEQMLYERGPGRLLATVHLRAGVVRRISYSRQAE